MFSQKTQLLSFFLCLTFSMIQSNPCCANLAVKHYMLKPIQRIPQYQLLLTGENFYTLERFYEGNGSAFLYINHCHNARVLLCGCLGVLGMAVQFLGYFEWFPGCCFVVSKVFWVVFSAHSGAVVSELACYTLTLGVFSACFFLAHCNVCLIGLTPLNEIWTEMDDDIPVWQAALIEIISQMKWKLNWLQLQWHYCVFRAALHHNWILFASLIIIFLFITVKHLWNNRYCINHCINKDDSNLVATSLK